MTDVATPRYRARQADGAEDIRAAQSLRYACFIAGGEAKVSALRQGGLDIDPHDTVCRHILIEETASGLLVGCFRLMTLTGGSEIERSYSAQFYGLGALATYRGPMLEMGRFCIAPGHSHPDVLRVAWAALVRIVDETGAELLFGCSSFQGCEADGYLDAFALLAEKHLAPHRWRPGRKAPSVFRFAERLRPQRADAKKAILCMPPLLRSYLTMGGWVSDHAVVDRDLGTLHVFTGLEIANVPPARARSLRHLAGIA
ncbi:MAG: GNAT family N-acyltransferase [Pseudomonadota bacterium]